MKDYRRDGLGLCRGVATRGSEQLQPGASNCATDRRPHRSPKKWQTRSRSRKGLASPFLTTAEQNRRERRQRRGSRRFVAFVSFCAIPGLDRRRHAWARQRGANRSSPEPGDRRLRPSLLRQVRDAVTSHHFTSRIWSSGLGLRLGRTFSEASDGRRKDLTRFMRGHKTRFCRVC